VDRIIALVLLNHTCSRKPVFNASKTPIFSSGGYPDMEIIFFFFKYKNAFLIPQV
jgi:hypothetical protein